MMKSGHWLRSVLCVHFTALTLMAGWQEGHPTHQKPGFTNPQRFFSGTDGGRQTKEELADYWLTLVHLETTPRSIASSLFKLRAWQSFRRTSFHVLFGLPLHNVSSLDQIAT